MYLDESPEQREARFAALRRARVEERLARERREQRTSEARNMEVCTTCRERRPTRIREPYVSGRRLLPSDVRAMRPEDYTAPIWDDFARVFVQCSEGCQPVRAHTFGERSNPRSCHPSGQAVDIHGLSCSDGTYMAIDNSYKFQRFKNCMGQHMNIIWHNGDPHELVQVYRRGYGYVMQPRGYTATHYDHLHVDFGCNSRRSRYR